MKPKTLSRREVIRVGGITLGLPFLEAMLPWNKAYAAEGPSDVRTLFIYKPNGEIQGRWGSGTSGGPTGIYAPMAALGSYVSILENLKQPTDGVDYSDSHAPGIGRYLNGDQFNPSKDNIINKRTLDWIIGDARGRSPHFLASNEFIKIYHAVLSDEYFNYVSWKGPRAATPIVNPSVFFTTLFGSIVPSDPLVERQIKNRKSILDFTKNEISRVTASLGKDDKAKMDEYLSAVRDVEKKSATVSKDMNECKADTGSPVIPSNYNQWVEVMFDLIYRAFQCDPQQLITLQFAPEVGFPNIGGYTGMHHISHYNENTVEYQAQYGRTKLEDFEKICIWYAQQVTNFSLRLRNTVEPDGKNLLDKSMVVYGVGLGDSHYHLCNDPITVLMGRANGKLAPMGRYVNGKGARHANLLLKLGQVAGLNINKFGTSTGVLSGV